MRYLTRLSFLSDGASGSDVYDGIRRVGWVRPGSIGLCALASEAAAIVAAALAYRELSRRFRDNLARGTPTSNGAALVVAQIAQRDWITDGDVTIARLYRPKSRDRLGNSTYAVELTMCADVATGRSAHAVIGGSSTAAWRAAYAAVQKGLPEGIGVRYEWLGTPGPASIDARIAARIDRIP